MSEDDSADKSHEPTQKKLDDARKKGEVPRSTDLNTAASYAALLLVAVGFGFASMLDLGTALSVFLDQPDQLAAVFFKESAQPLSIAASRDVLGPLAPWFIAPGVAVLVSVIAQRAFIVTPDKLRPKLSRISILSNAKNKFGRSGLFEFAKSATKLIVFCLILGVFLWRNSDPIVGTIYLSPAMALTVLGQSLIEFIALVFVIAVAIGAVDFFWQRFDHTVKNRMSQKDLKDEVKNAEGDPQFKAQRRQRGYEIAMNQMLADVPKADVVVVNPTHYAVALQWSRLPGAAPIVVAKGVDEIAARIRETALDAGVAIHRDPPTARAIYATVEIGQEVLPDHYKPVAAAIRFADAMREKARRP